MEARLRLTKGERVMVLESIGLAARACCQATTYLLMLTQESQGPDNEQGDVQEFALAYEDDFGSIAAPISCHRFPMQSEARGLLGSTTGHPLCQHGFIKRAKLLMTLSEGQKAMPSSWPIGYATAQTTHLARTDEST
jgi:hypothetical protein